MRTVALGLLALAACRGAPPEDAGPRPVNVVLVVTDDQGAADFGHRGHPALDTPHLDRLARESPVVERFYVNPVCSPTRASLLTGRWSQRTRVVDTWVGRSMMEPDEVTLAEVLSEAGYATGAFGKWHLGDCHPMRPIDQGFDTALVHRGGGLAQPSEPPENARRYTDPILFRDGEPVATAGYCTDVYFDAAIAFVDASLDAGRPFFAYVATNAPHDPFHDVPADLYAKYLARADRLAASLPEGSPHVDREARICAMIENIDANVGRLRAHLAARGVADDTLFVFLNDNGPVGGRSTGGLRGAKASVYEGGIRAALFVRWPGRLDPGTVADSIGAHVDLFPTVLDAVGVAPPADVELDGRSLLPMLRGAPRGGPARRLFLQSHRGNAPAFEHHFAVVEDRWKLVRASGFGRSEPEPDHPFELYDLAADPGETRDRAAEHPGVLVELRAAYARWFEDVSSTRPDNWAPPRIVVGTAAERRTVLTRQDWRVDDAGGWGEDGVWRLAAPEPVALDLTVLLREPAPVDRVRVFVDGTAEERRPAVHGARATVGPVTFPAGPVDLRVECWHASKRVPVHQVVIRSRTP